MYCKKCKFHSFDHVSTCPKCGADWEESRKALYLNWITASGVNWLSPELSAPQAAPEPSVATAKTTNADTYLDTLSQSSVDYSATPPAPPAQVSNRDTDIDVSLFPDLDFAMTDSKPEAPAPAPAPKRSAAAPTSDDDLFLESLPVDEMVELDFSTSFDAPAEPKAQAPSKPKREDLFIPELEEMLAPLTDEPRPSPSQPKKQVLSDDTDILLDFGSDSSSSSGRKSGSSDELYLDLDDPKKSS